MLDLDRDRLVQWMTELAEIGSTSSGGISRLALSDEDARAREWFEEQLRMLDMPCRVDRFGNMFARLDGTDPSAAPVLIGSHLDSQPDGGIYDGQLGICASLEFLRSLRDSDQEPDRPIEIVNWTNEEGARFQPPMQGSGVWAGVHDVETEYEKTDSEGRRLLDELDRIGYRGSEPCEPAEEYAAYLELHIEQGPYLETNTKDVGVVTGIVGQTWGKATFTGEANHSGPTAMYHRSDALVAAADAILSIRRLAGTLGERTVGTAGSIDVTPDSPNVIPEHATITWEFRDPDDEVVEEASSRIRAEIAAAADREGVDWDCEEVTRVRSVDFSDRCIAAVRSTADALGYSSMELVSGAGHDPSHVATVCDTGMVFAVSEDGKSHTPSEFTSWDDCYRSATTFANAALRLATDDA